MTKTSSNTQNRRKKQKKRIRIGLAIFLSLIIIGGVFYLHSRSFKSFVFEKVNQHLQTKYNLSLSAESFDFSIFRLSAVLDKLEVRPVSPSQKAILSNFTAQRLSLNIASSTLFSRKIHVQELLLIHPHLALGQIQPQKSLIHDMNASRRPLSLEIDKFLIDEGSIGISDEEYPVNTAISNIHLDIHYQNKKNMHSGLLRSDKGEVVFKESRVFLKDLHAVFMFDDESMKLKQLAIKTDPLELTMTGKVTNIQQVPQYDLDVQGSLHLGKVKEALRLDGSYQGTLSLKGSVRGNGKEFTLAGNIIGASTQIADISLPEIKAAFEANTNDLSIDDLEITGEHGHIKGKFQLSLSKDRESFTELQWNDIELSSVRLRKPQLLQLVSSKCSGRLTAKWEALAFNATTARGEIRFDPSGLSLPAAQGNLRLRGQFSFETSHGNIKVLPSSIHLNRTHVSFSGNVDRAKKFQAKLKIEAEDLAEIDGFLKRLREDEFLSEDIALPTFPTEGQLSLESTAQGTFDEPKATIYLKGQDILYKPLKIPHMEGRFVFDPTGIDVAEFSLEAGQGHVQAHGRLSFNLRDKSFGPNSKFTVKAQRMDITPIASLTQKTHSVKGLLSGNMTFTGSPYDPGLQFSLSCENFVFDKEEISLMECQGHLLNQNLELEKILISKGVGRLEGTLGVGLQEKQFHLDLIGQALELSDFQTVMPSNSGLAGTVHFQLKGNGRFENPMFNLDASIERLIAADAFLSHIEIKADSDGQLATLRMNTPAGHTSIEATLQLQEPFIIRGRFETQSLDTWSILRSRVEPLPSPVSTTVTAAATFVVPLRNWKQSSAQIGFEKLAFRYKNYSIQNHQPIAIQIANQEISWEHAQLRGPNTEFSTSGKLPLNQEKKAHVSMDGSLNLRVLEAFLPSTEITGSLFMTSEISGTFLKPVLNAKVELRKGSITPSTIPYSLHDMALLARIQDNIFELDKFSLGVDGGNISASGKFHLSSLFVKEAPTEANRDELAQNEMILTVSNLDLGNLVDFLPEKPAADVGGVLEGSLRFQGDLFSTERIKLTGELTKLEFLLSRFRLTNKERIQLSMDEGIFRMNNFRLSGGESFIQADLTLSPEQTPQMEGRLSTNLNISTLTPLFEDIVLDGNLSLELDCRGPLNNLKRYGKGRMTEGFFQLQNYPLLITDIEGGLQLSHEDSATVTLSGILNGGKTNVQGNVSYQANQLTSLELLMAAEQVQLNFPDGFQGLSSGRLTLNKKEQQWFLSGEIELTQSFFGFDVFPGSELIKTLRSRRKALQSDIPPRIRALNLNIGIATVNPFIVDNNLASLEMDSNLRVRGTVYEPRLSGYARNRQSGEIVFGNRNYDVEQASLDFSDVDPLDGRINIIAHTQARLDYDMLDITLTVTGPITNLNFSLSSSPVKSQIELASLLITGYGTERLKAEAANILGNQLMLHFLSPLASPFTNRMKAFLRAEEVRIEPINIATEEDPGARFTFRKGLIHNFDLVYSIDISNTQNQTWILDYGLSRNFSLQSFAKDDGSYGGSFTHRFFLGGPAKSAMPTITQRSKRHNIKAIRFSETVRFARATLEKLAQPLKKGSVFNYGDLRMAIDKLSEFYRASRFLNVAISPSLQYEDGGQVTITFNISPKEPASLVFVGDPISSKLKKQIMSTWNGRLPEEMSMAEAEKQVRLDLNSRGYIQAEVTASKEEREAESFYPIFVHLGPRYRIGQFTLSGESSLSAEAIKKALSGIPRARGKGLWALLYDFKRAKLRIASQYEDLGYQSAVIEYPMISPNPANNTIDLTLPIHQGIQSRIHSIEINGNHSIATPELKAIMRLRESALFSPNHLATDINMLFSFYRARGYQDVDIDVQSEAGSKETQIQLAFNITEGDLRVISEIAIVGNRRTSERLIRRELVFREGNPLNMEDIIASQKNLHNLLVFKTVNIRREPVMEQGNKVRVVVEVIEDPRFAVSYGLRFNSEEKIEVFSQLDFINLTGQGSNGLIFYKQNQRQKDLRFSLGHPYFLGKKFNTLYSVYYLEETESVFKSEEFGFSVRQELLVSLNSTLSYLLRLNRIHTYELESLGPFPFDFTYFLPELQVFWLRDTRLNKINAAQGSFLSLSLKYSPSFLKTDLTFISFFGQYSLYLPIGSRLVWASNYRIGLSDAFEQVLIPSRRFFAGGANSIRGFDRDAVGPYDPYMGLPEGGESLFIMNQELRSPVFKWIEGVVFFDMGNVYQNLGDFNPLKVRTAIGAGLRLNFPVIFLRLDYGINLSPREFESRSVFYFSIGQAF